MRLWHGRKTQCPAVAAAVRAEGCLNALSAGRGKYEGGCDPSVPFHERFDAVDHGLVASGMEQVERVLTAGELRVNERVGPRCSRRTTLLAGVLLISGHLRSLQSAY